MVFRALGVCNVEFFHSISESNLHRKNGWNVVNIEYSTDTVVIAVYTSDVGKFGGTGKAVQSVSCDSSAIITVIISIDLLVGFELRSCQCYHALVQCLCPLMAKDFFKTMRHAAIFS